MVQRKCKPNAIKLAWIAEVQPFLSKDTRNKIVEVKVDGLPTSAQEEPKQESRFFIFAFLKDGNLPIDNNLAERAIRPLTT